MRVVGVGVDQADADGTDATRFQAARGLPHALLVERAQFLALEVHAAADLEHQIERHRPFWLHPEIGIAVAVRHRLPGDLQHVAEAGGDNQAERVDRALQERVGRDRGAVGETDQLVGGGADLAEDLVHAVDETEGGISRRARHLGHGDVAGGRIDANNVGEGAAGVDADPQMSFGGSLWRHGRPSLTRKAEIWRKGSIGAGPLSNSIWG